MDYKNFRRAGGTGTGSASETLIGLVTGIAARIPSLADRLEWLKTVSHLLLVKTKL